VRRVTFSRSLARIEGKHQLALPAGSVFGNDLPDRFLLAAIAARAVERRGDVFGQGLDTNRFGQRAPEPQGVVRAVSLRHEQTEHAALAEGAGAQRGHHRAVDATRYADHRATPTQRTEHLGSKRLGDTVGLRRRVERE
jgi:hypothetical protein